MAGYEEQGLVHGPPGRGGVYPGQGPLHPGLRRPAELGPEDAGQHRQVGVLLLRPHHPPVQRGYLASLLTGTANGLP